MRSIVKSLSFAAVLFLGFVAQWAAAGPITLQNGKWHLLVVPGTPVDNTVEGVFGDALPVDDLFPLGSSRWAVYTFDAIAQEYQRATGTTVLGDGVAFWIAQITGADVSIDMPDVSVGNVGAQVDGCANSAGCFSVALPTDQDATRWQMTGSPFVWSVAPDDMRVKTDQPICDNACTLEVSDSEGYTGDTLFVYDTGAGQYQSVSGDSLVSPWSGFWLDALPAADGLSPELLIPDTSVTVAVSGLVTEPDGSAAAGVSVEQDGDVLAITDADGIFSISLQSDASHVLQFVSDDYANQVRIVELPRSGGQVNIEVTVLKRGLVTTFDPNAPFTIVGPAGAVVEAGFGPPVQFVDENDDPVSGPVEVSITAVDVIDPALRRGFPGSFLGSPEDGAGGLLPASALISQGAVEFSFRDLSGNPLQLAQGSSAVIQIPLFTDQHPDGSTIAAGDSIALWSLNEDSGIWEQDGTGTVVDSALSPTGLALRAQVSHFTWWNCDVSPQTGTISVGVFGALTGTVNVIGSTSASIGWRPASVSTVTTVGRLTPPLFVPANEEVCVYADVVLDIGLSGSTGTTCVTVAAGAHEDIVFQFGADIFVDQPNGLALVIKDEQGANAGDMLSVDGAISSFIPPLTVLPTTLELTMSYTADNLPPGMRLVQQSGSVSVSIEGVASSGGEFDSVITGVDSDGNQDSVNIHYSISSIIEPPELVAGDAGIFFGDTDINLFASRSVDSRLFDLSVYNVGGLADTWSVGDIQLVDSDSVDVALLPLALTELPDGIVLDATTGELTVGAPFGDAVNPFGGFGERIVAVLRAENTRADGQVQFDEINISIGRGPLFGDGDGPPPAAF